MIGKPGRISIETNPTRPSPSLSIRYKRLCRVHLPGPLSLSLSVSLDTSNQHLPIAEPRRNDPPDSLARLSPPLCSSYRPSLSASTSHTKPRYAFSPASRRLRPRAASRRLRPRGGQRGSPADLVARFRDPPRRDQAAVDRRCFQHWLLVSSRAFSFSHTCSSPCC